MSFKVYIPARYASTRLPGKLLADLGGKPVIQHTFERAVASGAAAVVVATDDERIATVAEAFGAAVVMTGSDLASGSDRVAAAATATDESETTVIVNLQGDEPAMPASVIGQVAAAVEAGGVDIATVCEPLEASQVFDPNVVKVTRADTDRALYFSRAPIPWDRERFGDPSPTPVLVRYRRHVGIYAYRFSFLKKFVAWSPTVLEQTEALEQLRALEHGASIAVPDALEACGVGIDTPEDLARARELLGP